MAKKLRTPIIKPRRQGGTFYTFGSAMEDIGLNVNESHNRVEISHYVLLDLPRFSYKDIDTDLPYINFGNNKYDGDLYTKDSSSQGDFIFADSFQNYCLNMETVLRNQDRYDYASNKTVSERAFWKWLFGHMENSGELVSDGSYFYETKEKSIAKGFGSISAGAQRTDDSGLYNETFVQIPSSYGQMRVLFKKSLDENYLDGKEYIGTNTKNLIENISEGEISEGGMIYFYMLNNDFTYPNPNATVQVRGITSTTTYTLTVVKSDKDNYLIQCLLGNINTNNIPSGNGVLVVNGVAQTYNYFLKSESLFDIIRSTGVSPYAESDAEEDASTAMYGIYDDIDKLEVEFDINKLRNYYSDLSLTYDDIGMGNVDKQSVIDSGYGDYTFNAILVYYSIYDSNKTKRLSTNAYGLYVLDNAISSSDDAFGVDSSSFYFPSIYKRMGTQKKNGTSYSFRINVKPSTAYSGDITVNDNSTEAYSMSEDFNDVLRNLTSAVTIMKENAKMLYKISRDNEDVRRFASDTMERVNSMENEVMNIRNGNYPYTASSIFVESGSYTYALPTGLANNIIDSFTITYDSDGSMKLDINDSGLNSSELAIVDRLRKAMNNKNFLDVISIMMLLITALKNIDTTGSGSSDDSSSESAMTPDQIEDYIDGYVDNIVSNIDSLQENVIALGNSMNDIADDITLGMTSNHKVEVKDREYIVGTQSQMGQMGYVILKRQQTFKTQVESVTSGNTIFEIRYDYDLGGATVNIPANCVLKFEGGSISNGTVVGNNSTIKSDSVRIFYNVFVDGIWSCVGDVAWFATGCEINEQNGSFSPDNNDETIELQLSLDSAFKELIFPPRAYYISQTLILTKEKKLHMSGGVKNIYLQQHLSTMLNTTIIYATQDITLLDVAINQGGAYASSFEIVGGSLDTSLVNSYTSSCIKVSADKNERIWGFRIQTLISGSYQNTTGCGIYINPTGENDVIGGYVTMGYIDSFIKNFGVGIKIDSSASHWTTDITLLGYIQNCPRAIVSEASVNIKTSIQTGAFFQNERNGVPAIELKGSGTVSSLVHDLGQEDVSTHKWSNEYALQISNKNAVVEAHGQFLANLMNSGIRRVTGYLDSLIANGIGFPILSNPYKLTRYQYDKINDCLLGFHLIDCGTCTVKLFRSNVEDTSATVAGVNNMFVDDASYCSVSAGTVLGANDYIEIAFSFTTPIKLTASEMVVGDALTNDGISLHVERQLVAEDTTSFTSMCDYPLGKSNSAAIIHHDFSSYTKAFTEMKFKIYAEGIGGLIIYQLSAFRFRNQYTSQIEPPGLDVPYLTRLGGKVYGELETLGNLVLSGKTTKGVTEIVATKDTNVGNNKVNLLPIPHGVLPSVVGAYILSYSELNQSVCTTSYLFQISYYNSTNVYESYYTIGLRGDVRYTTGSLYIEKIAGNLDVEFKVYRAQSAPLTFIVMPVADTTMSIMRFSCVTPDPNIRQYPHVSSTPTGYDDISSTTNTIRIKTIGTTSQRPNKLGTNDAYLYFDTTLGKTIIWNGTDWVNLDGTALN